MNHKNQYGSFYTEIKIKNEMKAILKISADFGFWLYLFDKRQTKIPFVKR